MTRFPIMDHIVRGLRDGETNVERGDTAPPVTSVPWDLVEPLRARCLKVHDQTLERLAERGGLSLFELFAHVHGFDIFKSWDNCPTPDALRAWARSKGGLP